jgi:2-polyprenyl-3-methyl-5-hydroxy-6-metoxy-1,4-benzoquinol methylase
MNGVRGEDLARGKPAEYGQEIVKRRFRLTASMVELGGKRVLDFGCGNGAQTLEFLRSGCRITAVDIDFNDLGLLSGYLKSLRVDSVLPIQYDGSHLPIRSGSIDVVVSYEVLEHVRSESQTLHELHRVLRSDGMMVVSVPNKRWVFETHGANLPLLPWNRVPFFSWLPTPIHRRLAKARIYRKTDITRLLSSHGFEVLQARYITAPMDVVKNRRLKTLLRSTIFNGDSTALPFLSTSILVSCRKTHILA